MANRIKKIVDSYKREQLLKKKVGITLMILSLFVVTSVFWSLKLNGIAMSGDAFCGLEEHKHNDECYNKQFICDKEEHTHTLLCYSDMNADKEDQTKWEATLPKLSNHWSHDLITVAKSQLGYQESERNFVLAEDNQTRKGYTRYGGWYGNEYGDWNGMFLAFCMSYANLSQDMIPITSSYQTIVDSLTKQALFETKNYNPNPGDIVFLNNQRVAIIIEVNDSLRVIEGDVDNEVKEITYAFNDERICGYGNIQKAEDLYVQMNISSLKAIVYTDQTYQQIADDQTKITVTGTLPEGSSVKAYPIHTTIQNYETVISYDISIILADGTVYEPKDQTLKVQITLPEKETEKLSVYHIPDSSEPEEIKADITNNDITFETTHFSVYAVVKAPRVSAENTTVVSNANDFVNAFANGDANIQLNENITVNSRTEIKAGTYTVDLNGHTLIATSSDGLFNVTGGMLTIQDSQKETENVTSLDLIEYGKSSTFENNKLTYYVTETEVTNTSVGSTKETLKKHEVEMFGNIDVKGGPVISMSGGTVNIESGMIHGGTNRAVNMTGGTLNLAGGYIFGFNNDGNGGAITTSKGIINLSGTVLAKNISGHSGGAIAVNNSAKLYISGNAIVSGNQANGTGSYEGNNQFGGGGIYCGDNTVVAMSGGFVTHNFFSSNRYFDGGGGIFLSDQGKFVMDGGYITANKAQGGGGIKTNFGKATTVTINFGYISGNEATAAEGAGISIDRNGTGSIISGYITNNKLTNTVHWGGGGLFCADGSNLYIKKALITENEAGGFGGGIAGCPTGKIYLYIDDGCAVYDNDDIVNGDIHWVHGGAKDGIDAERCDEFFQSHGHKDYFCALNSTVTGTMLGNVTAGWQGSADGTPVNLGASDAQTAMSVMGLESHPTDEAKEAAQNLASVYIHGNYSYTHGGGILCNGNLIVGNPVDIEVPAHLSIIGTKTFLDLNGNNIEDLTEYNFKFQMTNDVNKAVSFAKANGQGEISFDTLEFNAEGTYVYTIKEIQDTGHSNIVYDNTEYKVTITVGKKTLTIEKPNADTIPDEEKPKVTSYVIKNVEIKKHIGNEQWETISNVSYGEGKDNLLLPLTSNQTFTNRIANVSKITVIKEWANGKKGSESVTVDLYQDEIIYETVVLNEENNWTYTWIDLPTGFTYRVVEREVKGYITSYTTSINEGSRVNYWVPASSLIVGQQYMIVDQSDSYALYISQNHQNSGFDSTDKKNIILKTGTLTIGSKEYTKWILDNGIDSRCIFEPQTSEKSGHAGLILKNKGTSANTWLLVQNANNNYLKGTSGANYASFMTFENGILKGQDNYNWNPNNLRTVIYSGDKFNTSQETGNAAQLYTLLSVRDYDSSIITITNTPEEKYELPETGGKGTEIFAMIGLLLMLTTMVYKFKFEKRIKEE